MPIIQWARSALSTLLIFGIVNLGSAVGIARAELVSTASVVERPDPQLSPRARIKAMLAREDVRSQLASLGVHPEEAGARVDSLSDREIAQLHSRLEELPAGQSFVGAVLGVAAVTLVVLLFLDLLGFTDVFPFIRPLPKGDTASR